MTLPLIRTDKDRAGDIAKFCQSTSAKYTGKTSDKQILSRHQVVYYAQFNIMQLTAAQGLDCLINMIDTQSLGGTFYFNGIVGQVRDLEEAFEKLFVWSRQSTNYNLFVREWIALKISHFKNDSIIWAAAIERLYGRPTTLLNELEDVHKHPVLLIKILGCAVQDQPSFLSVDRVSAQQSPQSIYFKCLLPIQKESFHDKKHFSQRQGVDME